MGRESKVQRYKMVFSADYFDCPEEVVFWECPGVGHLPECVDGSPSPAPLESVAG